MIKFVGKVELLRKHLKGHGGKILRRFRSYWNVRCLGIDQVTTVKCKYYRPDTRSLKIWPCVFDVNVYSLKSFTE